MEEKKLSVADNVWAVIGLIVIIFVICNVFKSDNNKPTDEDVFIEQNKNAIMEQTNNILNEARSGGLVMNINKQCEGNECLYVMQINERVWNELPHDTKENFRSAMRDYAKSRGANCTGFKGYYSGKLIW